MILIAYDGSLDAGAAIDLVGRVMPGALVAVVTVWEPFANALLRRGTLAMSLKLAEGQFDTVALDRAGELVATETAHAGALRAQALGLRATSQTARRSGDVAHTIVRAADRIEAEVIAVGTRGLSELRGLVLGGVSHGVVQHATCGVLVAPSSVATAPRSAIPALLAATSGP